MLELAGCDQDAAGADEPADNRMRQQIGEEAKPQNPQHGEHHARQRRKRDRRLEILGTSLRGDRTGGRSRHQGNHRDRSDRQGATGPEDRISDQWQDRGVEADDRWESSQQGIGKALRDQHDRNDHRSDKIVGQDRSVVGAAPFQDRQIARKVAVPGHTSGDGGGGHRFLRR